MPVYTVHAPPAEGTDVRGAPDRFVFVRDGFSFWAFVFGPLWLLYQRLWLAFAGYMVLSIALEVVMTLLRVSGGTRLTVMVVIAVLMGLEAASLRRWTLSRRKWRQLDVVVADDREAAERRFFDRWTTMRGTEFDPLAVDRGAPPPTRSVPEQPFAPPRGDIVGLFPQPGMPR
ncbi:MULTISPECIES: DUF2628 domain-containing protein [unclassified Nitrobacter]|uniref:DUF2628 domain-containing protein n=1 Tax=unclassified Nitrobacter TaxID=2620411 RepID=UPI00092791E6|nr:MULTISPECIES: DUF2628 domain-containing protein [unclassified Nitrobacter]MBN9148475.1 DUF2628 domain-containing protein [Nitrobacter sp.]OJV00126.1 MAG: hypothetical protein BGO16_06140 [Nitrobacter sp. 62-23]